MTEGRVPDPNPTVAAGTMIPTPAFVFGAKSQARLSVACDLVCYYKTTECDLTAVNMRWTQAGKNFDIQWNALKARKDEDDLEVLKITRSLPIIKWTEAFQDFLHQVIGMRTIPLAYVIRITVDVLAAMPALQPNQLHSNLHGSVAVELVARALHAHALF